MMTRFLALLTLALALSAPPARADEFSANPTTITALLGSGQVLLQTAGVAYGRGKWFVMNLSAGRIWVVLDDARSAAVDATDSSRAIFALDPGSGANAQGGSMGWQDTGEFTGRIRIYGAAGSQVALTRN